MPSHRILQLNAVSTAVCAAGMLARRGSVALIVEVFATLQFRAAGKASMGSPQIA